MKPRIITILIGIATLAAAAFATDLPPAWRSWHYSRTLTAPHPDILNYAVIDRDARGSAISKQVRIYCLSQSLAGARDNANVDGIVVHRGAVHRQPQRVA